MNKVQIVLSALLCTCPVLAGCDGGDQGTQGSDGGSDGDSDADGDTDGDSDSDSDTDTDTDADTDTDTDDGWLHVEGNHIYTSDDEIWRGRGVNIHDTRSCNACTYQEPDVDEVNRRIDEAVDVWGANFLRLTLEAYESSDGWRIHWGGAEADSDYLEDVEEIVEHIGSKDGVYVLLSLWIHPSFSDMGWPTEDTAEVWELLAQTFAHGRHVLFGLVNEPQSNLDGSLDADVWESMNDTVAAIREVEEAMGVPSHIVAVQGTRGWGRSIDYYVDNPIEAGGGNVVYETHVYNPTEDFEAQFEIPSETIPVIIGEFGPFSDAWMEMTLEDCGNLIDSARSLHIPHLAWTFHMRCPPNLLVDNSGGGCGVGMDLEPTQDWGQLVYDRLAQEW